MCGLPAAGKSSIAEHLRGRPPAHVVCSCVCFDEVERSKGAFYGSEQALIFDAVAWKKARESAMSQVEQELHSATASTLDGLVIVDDNMYYRSMRHDCLQLARKYQAAYIQLYIRCPAEVALQRNASRSQHQGVPEAVMRRMERLFEVPDPQKHAWEANTIVLDGSRLEMNFASDEIWQQILGMWKDPVQPVADAATLEQTRQHGRAANELSLQHQLDLFCRKAVSEIVQQLKANKGVDQHQLASTARSLNAARQAAMAAFKASAQCDSSTEYERQREHGQAYVARSRSVESAELVAIAGISLQRFRVTIANGKLTAASYMRLMLNGVPSMGTRDC
ncbi:hypothetical protein WJX79_001756 [Trebouxia sp. C0005]